MFETAELVNMFYNIIIEYIFVFEQYIIPTLVWRHRKREACHSLKLLKPNSTCIDLQTDRVVPINHYTC